MQGYGMLESELEGELEFSAEMESAERIFARTHPGGVKETDDSLELFNYLVDSADPRPEHLAAIRSAAIRLARRAFTDPTFAIQIVGHASSSGTPALNVPLARLRARRAADEFLRALRAALLARGIGIARADLILESLTRRMTVRGVSTREPAVSGARTPAELARNRRVEIFITAQA
jgi:outer membrane protein OmpA-like peptidoglycan-associated protein